MWIYICGTGLGAPVLSADLSRGSGLGAYFSAEGRDFLNDQSLHALDGIFLLEPKVERLAAVAIHEQKTQVNSPEGEKH